MYLHSAFVSWQVRFVGPTHTVTVYPDGEECGALAHSHPIVRLRVKLVSYSFLIAHCRKCINANYIASSWSPLFGNRFVLTLRRRIFMRQLRLNLKSWATAGLRRHAIPPGQRVAEWHPCCSSHSCLLVSAMFCVIWFGLVFL